MRRIDLRGRELTTPELLAVVPRATRARAMAQDVAANLVADVRERGEGALRDQAAQFDHVVGHHIRVSPETIDAALATLDTDVRAALAESILRVRRASAAQVPPERTIEIDAGATITQRWQPVGRAGVYIPGGKAVYPSSVVMNVVPAQVAGVRQIALASPAQADHGGAVHPMILATAGLLGVREVYAMGGAGAIGALAVGIPSLGLEPVDTISGPGNNFVAAAKRAVVGLVGTDSEAGASEILVVADSTAYPDLVAADLISQAEHDEQASAVLVTDDQVLAEAVTGRVAALAENTLNAERVHVALEGPQSAIVLVDNIDQAVAFSNSYAPEHLELHLADAARLAARFTNAGAVFVGDQTPVSLGDYLAGSNHVLPTGGQARYAAGLSAATFLRPQQVVEYDHAALANVRGQIILLADSEGLPAHGEAVTARFAGDQTEGDEPT